MIAIGDPRYYGRFGFEPARPRGILTRFHVPDEAFMALALTDGALDESSGMVAYSQSFEEL